MDIPVKRGLNILRQEGMSSFGYNLLNYLNIWLPAWNTVTSRKPVGTNIFERDWDLLIVLDACRVDALREAAESTPWLGSVESMRSVGSMSAEWMVQTFTEQYADEISNTAIVTGNGWSNYILYDRYHETDDHENEYLHNGYPDWQVVRPDTIQYHESVRPTDDHLPLHPDSKRIPHAVTDRAIGVGRTEDFDRMIVHYNLPHQDHIAGALDWERDKCSMTEMMNGPEPVRDLRPEEMYWEPGRSGEVSADTYRSNYLQTLHFVLEYVEILLENIDAESVAITADHGEAFCENGAWGHPFGHPFAPVKTVPWAETSATDGHTYESRFTRFDVNQTVDEQREFLREMGYLG